MQIDGKSDPSWVTPFTLPDWIPVKLARTASRLLLRHTNRRSHLRQQVVRRNPPSPTHGDAGGLGTPAGANIYIDGKDTGKLTRRPVSIDKGQHTILVRKSGFLDETNSAPVTLGPTVNFSPTMRPLGNVDDIKTVGKMDELLGRKEAQNMADCQASAASQVARRPAHARQNSR